MANILIADDDAHMVRLLSLWLARNGFKVFEAADGLAAQSVFATQAIDLVVSDVNMPKLDGISLVRWIRLEMKRATPVLLLSSRCDQASMAAKLSEFGVRVFPKPFSPSRLVEEITRTMQVQTPA